MEGLFGAVNLGELRMTLKPMLEGFAGPVVDVVSGAQKEASHRKFSFVAGDGLAMAIDRGIEEAKDMELVGDDTSVGEEILYEGSKGLAHVDDDIAYVFASGDVTHLRFELTS